MGNPVIYRGFWGMRSGQAIEAIYDFLTWNREDWVNFTKVLDALEKKKPRGKKYTRRQWSQTLHSLVRTKILEPRQSAGRTLLRLTNRGWKSMLIARVRQGRGAPTGQWCFVSFDIPERHRTLRHSFRALLRECGFVLIQKSLWGCRRDVAELLRKAIDELDIGEWVTVIEGTKTERRQRH